MDQKDNKNVDIVSDLNFGENCFKNSIMTMKLRYFDHVERYSDLEITVVEGMVPRMTACFLCQGGQMDIGYIFGIRLQEAGGTGDQSRVLWTGREESHVP